MGCGECVFCSETDCTKAMKKWLQEEYEEKVDWSKVEVDTPILVRASAHNDWEKRHFAKYENGKIFAWRDGMTSFTVESGHTIQWNYAKLAEGKE